MTPNQVIYHVRLSKELSKTWKSLTDAQKREVIKECESRSEVEIERVILEVLGGQRRLF